MRIDCAHRREPFLCRGLFGRFCVVLLGSLLLLLSASCVIRRGHIRNMHQEVDANIVFYFSNHCASGRTIWLDVEIGSYRAQRVKARRNSDILKFSVRSSAKEARLRITSRTGKVLKEERLELEHRDAGILHIRAICHDHADASADDPVLLKAEQNHRGFAFL